MAIWANALMRGVLCSPEGEEGGGGGGEAAKPLTAADVEALVGKTVNAAVTSHMKRSLGPAIAESLKGVAWKDVLTPIVTELAPKPAEPSGGGDQKKPDPELAALRAQLEDLKVANAATEKARQELETSSRNERAMGALKVALTGKVRPELEDMVARDLFMGQKRVTFDEQGRPLLTVKRAPFPGSPEEDVQMTLEEGAAHYLKTEGKGFAPAPSAPGGNGSRGPQGGNRGVARDANGMPHYDAPATTDAEKLRRSVEQAEALALKYPHLAGR